VFTETLIALPPVVPVVEPTDSHDHPAAVAVKLIPGVPVTVRFCDGG
jgi:hypothetical protein